MSVNPIAHLWMAGIMYGIALFGTDHVFGLALSQYLMTKPLVWLGVFIFCSVFLFEILPGSSEPKEVETEEGEKVVVIKD